MSVGVDARVGLLQTLPSESDSIVLWLCKTPHGDDTVVAAGLTLIESDPVGYGEVGFEPTATELGPGIKTSASGPPGAVPQETGLTNPKSLSCFPKPKPKPIAIDRSRVDESLTTLVLSVIKSLLGVPKSVKFPKSLLKIEQLVCIICRHCCSYSTSKLQSKPLKTLISCISSKKHCIVYNTNTN